MKLQTERVLLRAGAGLIACAGLTIVTYLVTRPALPPPDVGARDVGDCVARGLVKQLSVGAQKAADIGSRIRDATDVAVGIRSQDTLKIIEQTMSDPVQAALVNACAHQYGAQPLYQPIVKVVDRDSREGIPGVT